MRIFLILLLLTSSKLFASVSYKKIESKYSNLKAKPTKLEKKISNNFKSLYKLANSGHLHKNLLSSLYADMKRSKTFYQYKVWPGYLIQVSNRKNLKSLTNLCTELSEKQTKSSVKSFLYQNVSKICFSHYLKELKRKNALISNVGFDFHLKYLKKHSKDIIKYHNTNFIVHLLSSNEISESRRIKLSNTLINYFIKNDITPSTKIISAITLTPSFTKYIQGKNLNLSRTQYTFHRELRTLTKAALKEVDDAKISKAQAKKATNKILNFFNSTYDFQNLDKSTLSLLSLGKSYMRRGYMESARVLFSRILAEKEFHYERTVFELLWSYTSVQDYSSAYDLVIKPYIKNPKNVSHNSKLSFWIAYTFEKLSKDDEAIEIYNTIVKENPLSYYAILASKFLGQEHNKATKKIYFKTAGIASNNRMTASSGIDYRWLKRIKLLSQINFNRFITLEVNDLINHSKVSNSQNHLIAAANELSKKQEYLDSFKLIYRYVNRGHLSVDEDALKILYPIPYYTQIKKNVKSFDPVIALSLIRQESGFNPKARSHVGARGLMQLMPTTAKMFKKHLRTKHLYNPALNLRIGTKYFKNLLNRYDNNLVYSLAAYNAGESRVDDWKKRNYLKEDFILYDIENIPFKETRKYVKLIFRNIFFYKMLYQKEEVDNTMALNQIFDVNLGF